MAGEFLRIIEGGALIMFMFVPRSFLARICTRHDVVCTLPAASSLPHFC